MNQSLAPEAIVLLKVFLKFLVGNAYLRWLNRAACLRLKRELSDTKPKVTYIKVAEKGQLTRISSTLLVMIRAHLTVAIAVLLIEYTWCPFTD